MPLITVHDGTTVILTIDRAHAANALDLATIAALTEAIRTTTGARVAIIMGAGDVFVSGGDLRELRGKDTRADAQHLSDVGFALSTAIADAPFPVIAAINGVAIGGGAELAVACDLRVASEKAHLAFKQARMGVTTSWGTAERLRELVGAGTAARLLLTCCDVGAKKAKKIGLVDEVVDDARVEALAWAADIAKSPASSISAMKRLLRAGGNVRGLERQLFIDTWASDEHKSAVESWFKQKP